jgi:hypothetical protein
MLSEQGFTDPDLREAVEWAYQRSKSEASLEDWIKGIKDNPAEAPIVLRPHLLAKASPETTAEAAPGAEAAPIQAEAVESAPLLPPRTNTGAKPAPVQNGDIISRGLKDGEFYEQNRDAIMKAWRQQRTRSI